MGDIMREWNEALTAPTCQHGHLAPVCDLCKKDAEIAALRAEVAGLLEDAERYRWLRGNSCPQVMHPSGYGMGNARGEQLDAAIDAARKGTT